MRLKNLTGKDNDFKVRFDSAEITCIRGVRFLSQFVRPRAFGNASSKIHFNLKIDIRLLYRYAKTL